MHLALMNEIRCTVHSCALLCAAGERVHMWCTQNAHHMRQQGIALRKNYELPQFFRTAMSAWYIDVPKIAAFCETLAQQCAMSGNAGPPPSE